MVGNIARWCRKFIFDAAGLRRGSCEMIGGEFEIILGFGGFE